MHEDKATDRNRANESTVRLLAGLTTTACELGCRDRDVEFGGKSEADESEAGDGVSPGNRQTD